MDPIGNFQISWDLGHRAPYPLFTFCRLAYCVRLLQDKLFCFKLGRMSSLLPTCRPVKGPMFLLCGTCKMPVRSQDRARVKGRKSCHAVRCCPTLFLWQPIVLGRPSCREGTSGLVELLFISSAQVGSNGTLQGYPVCCVRHFLVFTQRGSFLA